MMNKKTILYALITLFSLPILLHVYNPSMKLEGLGFLLGAIGYYVSPVLIFGILISLIIKSLKDE